MKFSNVVRFKIKQNEYDNAIAILSQPVKYDGLLQNMMIKTGENTICAVGIWESEAHIAAARPQMIAMLDTLRDKLEVISEELGVTDPVSGPVIYEA